MKPVVTLLTPFLALSAMSMAFADGIGEISQRCSEDSLDSSQAAARIEWFLRCEPDMLVAFYRDTVQLPLSVEDARAEATSEWLMIRGAQRPRPKYPTFLKPDFSNPAGYRAPFVANAACEGNHPPADYTIKGICTSSCYEPQTRVLFSDGYAAIKEAFDKQLPQIMTLSRSSTFSSLFLTPTKVDHYTEELKETFQTLVEIKTQSGGLLRVTQNHPLVNQNGEMKEAHDFAVGDALIKSDGSTDAIVSTTPYPFFGKVYNVTPRSEHLLKNIVVAEGFLSGSSWYQNDGSPNLNRVILRGTIPTSVLK